MAGLFITFEGIEGAGKSTLIAQLAEGLHRDGHELVVTREPGGTLIGDEIRTILLNPLHRAMAPMTELLLYAASRAQHVAQVIRPALAAGHMILCDRYADATAAYQGAARRIRPATIRTLRTLATDGVEPRLTILLDLPVAVGLARLSGRGPSDRLEGEDVAFHERVRQGYLHLAKQASERIQVIDATQSIATIVHLAMEAIHDRLG